VGLISIYKTGFRAWPSGHCRRRAETPPEGGIPPEAACAYKDGKRRIAERVSRSESRLTEFLVSIQERRIVHV
jgi:hypothetical protein